MKTLNERFPKIDFDSHSEIQVLKNDEEIIDLHEKWWGGENIRISKAELEELLKGNALAWGDGEYSHAIALE
ncbi:MULTISPECIES: hypothetical protein [Streptococcus]|jgi:hypothetical protein|uniref:Uncharacterized protein n=1 Tax=Streptococcus anginosus DORA_7 TaxID=1403946 RepID=W1TS88_STRAP|nr:MULTISPECIES: hypothetical protein [Streptococcus]ETI84497.1 MAG: hypothetical protein Q615_SPAC00127G0141 [Streptococcus anginosus DORA_7]QBX31710.1 hypothetical protein Javan68_0020 [Streptococcus phage Javan68]KAA9305140.1 hypothetical protein F6I02_03820 [Streptococcus anginosus]KAA9321246.1 hypothetical protein F6H95_09475 [Streptococcus anginosus]MCW1000107.1 hypothetical protein [Streptococcus anginosus]